MGKRNEVGMMNYTGNQKKYIDSVDGAAHMSAVEIIGELERALKDSVEEAWGVIANVGHKRGGWSAEDDEWVECAKCWRDKWLLKNAKAKSALI